MLSNLKKSLLTVGTLAAALSCVTSAQALTINLPQYQTSYTIVNYTGPEVDNLMMYQQSANGSSVTWGGGVGPILDATTQTFVNPFTDSIPVTSAVLFGLVGSDVVLGLSSATAALIAGKDWDDLFPNTTESYLAGAIALATSGGPFCDASQVPGCINPNPGPDGKSVGLNEIFDFGSNDAANIPFGDGTLNGQILIPGSLSLVEFTDGDVIGGGTAESLLTAVPEPATWAMMLLGFGAIGWTLRGRRKVAAVAA